MRAAGPGRRARASGGTRRAVGLRGGTGRTELLLFEWVWGQKLKSTPAGGQQSLFLGVFTSTSTEKGKFSIGRWNIHPEESRSVIILYNAPRKMLVCPCNFTVASLNT